MIGDGFSPRMVEAFLTVLAEDARFRDLPVAVLGEAPPDSPRALPNIDHVDGDPARLVARMVPLVRLHAFEARLKRMLKSLDAEGMFDPDTGLLDARRVLARSRPSAMRGRRRPRRRRCRSRASRSTARSTARASMDAARLVSRLIRNIDFACRDDDGSILVAFTETDLRSAHVVARRIASVLKHTMLRARPRRARQIAANVTLATLKAGDTLDTLMRA